MSNIEIGENESPKSICDGSQTSSYYDNMPTIGSINTDIATIKNYIDRILTLIRDIRELLNNCYSS